MRQVDVRYSEDLARAAVRAFYWRTLRQGFGWLGALAFLISLAALGFLLLAGDRSWFVGFIAACLMCVALILAWGYYAHLRNTTRRFRRMTNPQARFVFGDNDFSFSSELGSSTLLWASVREVWAFPQFWLFLLSKAHFITLPIEGVGEDTRAFIRSKTHVS